MVENECTVEFSRMEMFFISANLVYQIMEWADAETFDLSGLFLGTSEFLTMCWSPVLVFDSLLHRGNIECALSR